MIVIGVEASCDDTSVAVVNDKHQILSLNIISQTDMHKLYGGVVPELASRLHLNAIEKVFNDAIDNAGIKLSDIDAVCATAGPGLIGGLIVGIMFAKGLAVSIDKPFFPVNHLEGHSLTPRLADENLKFPYLLLLISGGNTQIVLVRGVGDYIIIGKTTDDACGECFDKVAKVLKLPYPNGVEIEKCAVNGDNNRFDFPKPMINESNADFSFSGLKSAVIRVVHSLEDVNGDVPSKDKSDVCASFQKVVCEILDKKVMFAFQDERVVQAKVNALVVAGGAGANKAIRETLQKIACDFGVDYVAPPLKLCTDNGAMIAWAGIERIKAGYKSDLLFSPKPRWPLSDLS